MIAKYFKLGRFYKLLFLIFIMSFWGFLFGYQYLFLNKEGEIPADEFDKNYFYKIFGLLLAGQLIAQLGRGYINYNFALEVSAKLNSLSKYLISY